MKILLKKILLLGILIFVLIEILLRIFPFLEFKYNINTSPYHQYLYLKKPQNKFKYLFLGTSRVSAAINTLVINDAQDSVFAINTGRGHCTPQTHYLGIQKLLEFDKNALRNCSVYIEAPLGLVEEDFNWQLDDRWVYNANLRVIVPNLSFESFKEFWKTANNSFRAKTLVSIYYFSKSIKIAPYLRYTVLRLSNLQNQNLFDPSNPELTTAGGIKNGKKDIKKIKAKILKYTQFKMDSQKPYLPWENSILNNIIQLVETNGGKVVFYEMPVPSIQARVLETKMRKKDKHNFQTWLDKKGLKMVQKDFKLSDEDFPDFLHLKISKATYFTKILLALE